MKEYNLIISIEIEDSFKTHTQIYNAISEMIQLCSDVNLNDLKLINNSNIENRANDEILINADVIISDENLSILQAYFLKAGDFNAELITDNSFDVFDTLSRAFAPEDFFDKADRLYDEKKDRF